MAVAQTLELETPVQPDGPRWWRAFRPLVSFAAILLALAVTWEGYKAIGVAVDGVRPCGQSRMPICPNDTSMPHVWNIVGALFKPAQRGNEEILLVFLLRAALFTWREAAVGFVIGSVVGFALGVVFVHSPLLERGLMPYVVASQTVPLLAIAPMVVIWGSRLNWPAWVAVTLISAYLTFFPVTINALRGLNSPDPTARELMLSYAASRWQVLWKLRVPAALPYLFTALKISATVSLIGAIIGELPSGIGDGLGRALLTFSYYYITGPEKLYAAILVAALLGIVFTLLVLQAERMAIPAQRRLIE